MPLTKHELTLIHVSVWIDADALAMPVVFQPFTVILAQAVHFLSKAVAHTLKPFTIVNVHVYRAVLL